MICNRPKIELNLRQQKKMILQEKIPRTMHCASWNKHNSRINNANKSLMRSVKRNWKKEKMLLQFEMVNSTESSGYFSMDSYSWKDSLVRDLVMHHSENITSLVRNKR